MTKQKPPQDTATAEAPAPEPEQPAISEEDLNRIRQMNNRRDLRRAAFTFLDKEREENLSMREHNAKKSASTTARFEVAKAMKAADISYFQIEIEGRPIAFRSVNGIVRTESVPLDLDKADF